MTDTQRREHIFDLTGKHVVVTGGSRGLGRAVAESVVSLNGEVTVVARSEDQAESTASELRSVGGRSHSVAADIADLANAEKLVDTLSDIAPIHGFVHAAGTQLRKSAVDVSVSEFLRVQAVNLHAPYILSAAVARRQLAEQRSGSHVFIGSLNSSIGLPGISPYVVSKTGLVGMARAFSTEWSARGVRANVVAPGYFATEMTSDLLSRPADYERIVGRIPAGDLGEPRDVGNTVGFLLGDAASYITGALINVDGGWLSS